MPMTVTAADREVLRRYAIEARDEFLQRQGAVLRMLHTWEPGPITDDVVRWNACPYYRCEGDCCCDLDFDATARDAALRRAAAQFFGSESGLIEAEALPPRHRAARGGGNPETDDDIPF